MRFHPMQINTNTRMRWHAMAGLPELRHIKGKRALDIGSGLGFFSLRLAELGASVLATDIDQKALDYLSGQYASAGRGISTMVLDIEKSPMPDGPFDLIFIGEVLEHVSDPAAVIRKAAAALSPEGVMVITTPALEGMLTDTAGKRLGHEHGSERHERDGFTRDELIDIAGSAGLSVRSSEYCIYLLAELFMQITKRAYLKKRGRGCAEYHGQSDIVSAMGSFKFKVLRVLYPLLYLTFSAEHFLSRMMGLKGHCHILVAGRKAA